MGRLPNVLSELKTILMSPIRAPKSQINKRSSNNLDDDRSNTFSEEDEDKEAAAAQINKLVQEAEAEQKELEVAGDSQQTTTTAPSPTPSSTTTTIDIHQNGVEAAEEDEEDLPSVIVRVMGKACTQILVTQPDEECCLTYLGLSERVLSHEAFSQTDKRRLQSWKAQCQKLARQLATNRKLAGIEKGPKK